MDATKTMPILRYIGFVGSLLVALLFAADWYLPKPAASEPTRREAQVTGIRIASTAKMPERIVYDTTQPTLVPAPAPVVAAVAPVANAIPAEAKIPSLPRDAFALATPISKPLSIPVRKKVRVAKRHNLNRVAAYQQPAQSPMFWRPTW
jgi:hypothetical protein